MTKKPTILGKLWQFITFFATVEIFFSILVCIQDIGKYQKPRKKVVLSHYLPTYTVCPIWKVKCDMGWTIRAIKNLMAHYGVKLLILPTGAHFWLNYGNFLLINLVSLFPKCLILYLLLLLLHYNVRSDFFCMHMIVRYCLPWILIPPSWMNFFLYTT